MRATRQRITRESEMLSRLDGSRLMVRQLAHEIKNPLGGLRGAAQLLDARAARWGAEGIHRRHHQRGRSAARAGRQHARAVAPAAEERASMSTSSASTCFTCCAARRRRRRRSSATTIRACRAAQFDRNEIIQALLNVGRNALQALPRGGGRVMLRTRVPSNINIGDRAPSPGGQHPGRGQRPRRAAGAARQPVLSAGHRPPERLGPRAGGRAGSGRPPRRHRRVRQPRRATPFSPCFCRCETCMVPA